MDKESENRTTAGQPDALPVIQLSETNVTIGEAGRRRWLYPAHAHGRFTRARNVVATILIALYLAVPWITISGQPILRFEVPGRRYSILGATFMATDLYLLALFLLIALVGLFLFSALLGRLWCGWGCPQTIYMEGVFRRIERWIEGSPLKRQKLDRGVRDDAYWAKKVTKHALFAMISIALALSFIGYFIDPRDSFAMLGNLGSVHPAAFLIAIVTAGFVYFDFAWFREQFCTFLCPYARLQAVMLDEHSLIVGYDPERGEPRGPLVGHSFEGRGDCIDCKRCVQVCPTGIDIRQGLQLECVSCTACIDACDTVMEKLGRPRGLIRYDSLSGLSRQRHRIVRPRVLLYTGVLALLLIVFSVKLSARDSVSLAVTRMAGVPYIVQPDGLVRNVFNLAITNTESTTRTVDVRVSGSEDAQLLVPGQPFTVEPGQRITAEAFVMRPARMISSPETPLQFHLVTDQDSLSVAGAVFLGPVRHSKDEHEHEDHKENHEE